MNIKTLTRRIRVQDLIYGLAGALLMVVNCYIAAIIYPQMPQVVFIIVIALGFLAGFVFGSTAVTTILQFLGAV